MKTKREHACTCGHGERAHMWSRRFKDCRVATCACIIYTRTSRRIAAPGAVVVTTVADRALIAARRLRDHASAQVDTWTKLCDQAPENTWVQGRFASHRSKLADADRTLAELTRGAGVPIAADDEGSEA